MSAAWAGPSGSASYLTGRGGTFQPASVLAPAPVPALAPFERSTGHVPMRPVVTVDNQRRNKTITVAAVAAIVVGLIGVILSLTFRPGTSEAQTQVGDRRAGGTSATNPYTPRQVCGSAFQVIDSAPLRSSDGVLAGRVFLLFNSVTGKNCTVTLKAVQFGVGSPASAYLEVQGAARSTDSGSFSYYAGPVKASAAGVCVKWGGSVGTVTYDSPFEHCT